MEWFYNCPYLVKNILLEKSIWRILNFVEALQSKSETTKFDYIFDCQRSFKVFVSYFSMILYLKAFQKKTLKMLYFISNFCICLISPDDPFVEEIYFDNTKLRDIMSWLNVIKKYIWLKLVVEKTFR